MAQIKKTQLQQLIALDRIDKVLEILNNATENDGDLHNQVIQLAGRHSRIQRESGNTVSQADESLERNRINSALTHVISQLPDNINITIPFDGDIVYGGEDDKETPTIPNPPNPTTSTTQTRNAVFIGVASLAVILAAVLFVPCPTSTQYIVFRIILALGAAGAASIIPGLFNFNNTILTASGALGVFGLVYLVNPAKNFADDESCQGAFDYTIFVESPTETIDFKSPAYLALRLEREYDKTRIEEDKTVTYKDIPTRLRDQLVLVELEAAGWQFLNNTNRDSIRLTGKSGVVQIQRDSSLCCVTGVVTDDKGNPIRDATVSIEDLVTVTDLFGRFKIDIPKARQKEQQPLKVRKNGYRVWDLLVRPGFQQVQLERE